MKVWVVTYEVNAYDQEGGDVHVSEGPYEVDTDSTFFWSKS